ncbi:hypothetical protein TRFO_26232 [Tritrichomonas foetus]|uniref:Uncharacterized protein n=1 Tax=Tritrichomonas foetus TaxID=1144522 RepID=A0A1J4K890_9EUKA|nr:hypothetical protein TRFO_26232 [Tritrichomonas foetus]|eukprot:OHT05878.1 hypothetical protein TRFO_26232 [Tritrichomonas foetus]
MDLQSSFLELQKRVRVKLNNISFGEPIQCVNDFDITDEDIYILSTSLFEYIFHENDKFTTINSKNFFEDDFPSMVQVNLAFFAGDDDFEYSPLYLIFEKSLNHLEFLPNHSHNDSVYAILNIIENIKNLIGNDPNDSTKKISEILNVISNQLS